MKALLLLSSCCVLLCLSACTGGGEDTPSTPETPTSITVSGKVLDESSRPVANVRVFVPGNNRQPVRTDASGAFSVPDVTPPYDIVTVAPGKEDLILLKGLTLRAPTLFVSSDDSAPRKATLAGTVSGGQTPYSTTNEPSLTFISPEVSEELYPLNRTTGAFSTSVSWGGPAATTGSIHALQSVGSSASGAPTSFIAYGRLDNVTLAEGGTFSGKDVVMRGVTNSTLAGTLTLPGGYTTTSVRLKAQLPSAPLDLFFVSRPNNSFSYPVPVLEQATYSLEVSATKEADGVRFITERVQAGLAAGSTTPLVLAESPELLQPANGARGVARSTPLSWTATAGGVSLVQLSLDTPTSPRWVIITREATTELPDLSALGLNPSANTELTWGVATLDGLESVDALVEQQLNNLEKTDAALRTGKRSASIRFTFGRTFTVSGTP